jgi:hypothetical protein
MVSADDGRENLYDPRVMVTVEHILSGFDDDYPHDVRVGGLLLYSYDNAGLHAYLDAAI